MLSVLLIQIIQLLHLSEPAQLVPINVKPLTVCEILADLAKYRGNVIQVRDEWLGTSLYGRDCAPPQTGDYVWEPAIWLIEPGSLILEKEGTPASWKLDQRAYDQATRALWQKKTGSATVIGRLDARSEGLQTSRGVGNGYGQLGRFPAQLVIVTVKDVSEKRR